VAYFLMPPVQPLARWMPSIWFLGLFQVLSGSAHDAMGPLAVRALAALAVSCGLALVTFGLAFQRSVRRIVEQPGIVPADRTRPSGRMFGWLVRRLVPRPVERAILLFTARAMVRSRQHRMLLAAYGGIGLAIGLAYARSLVYGEERWDEPGVSLLAGGFVLLFFSAIGTRAIFALPLALRANWIFRITAVHSPTVYFTAVQKAMLMLACGPVWAAAAVFYGALWPLGAAAKHLAVMVCAGTLLAYLLMYRFRKIPFACSYFPGKTDLRIRLGSRAIGFLVLADFGVRLEFFAMQRPRRLAILLSILAALAVWAWRRTTQFARSRLIPVQFEELPPEEMLVLDLQAEGGLTGGERYVDA
jgi:hypothetical protein